MAEPRLKDILSWRRGGREVVRAEHTRELRTTRDVFPEGAKQALLRMASDADRHRAETAAMKAQIARLERIIVMLALEARAHAHKSEGAGRADQAG